MVTAGTKNYRDQGNCSDVRSAQREPSGLPEGDSAMAFAEPDHSG